MLEQEVGMRPLEHRVEAADDHRVSEPLQDLGLGP